MGKVVFVIAASPSPRPRSGVATCAGRGERGLTPPCDHSLATGGGRWSAGGWLPVAVAGLLPALLTCGCSTLVPTPHGYAVLSRDTQGERLVVETLPGGGTRVEYSADAALASTATVAAGKATSGVVFSWFGGRSLLEWARGQTAVGLAKEQTAQAGIAADAATEQAGIAAQADVLTSVGNNPEASPAVIDALGGVLKP